MSASITTQFSYVPLVWIFHNKTMNNRIDEIHEKVFHKNFL